MYFFSPSIRRFSRWGKSAHREHLLAPPAELAGRGAEVIETDRGGDVTFHGPGQLVAYPIVHLAGWKKDVHAYLRALEAAAIETAAWFGTAATRREGTDRGVVLRRRRSPQTGFDRGPGLSLGGLARPGF